MGSIAYRHNSMARQCLQGELRGLMENGAKRFCDVGGGANPVVSRSEIEEFGLDYVVLDESQTEIGKAPSGYQLVRGNILDPDAVFKLVEERGAFDVVVSKWTAEHVPDGRIFHEQVYRMLRPGGKAVHLFPTLYSPVFVLNRLLPPDVSNVVLSGIDHKRAMEGHHAKFRPYYSWCRGPSRRQIRRLQNIGFSVELYTGFFGHEYYVRVRPLYLVHKILTDILLRYPLPSMTSFALVVITRAKR